MKLNFLTQVIGTFYRKNYSSSMQIDWKEVKFSMILWNEYKGTKDGIKCHKCNNNPCKCYKQVF